MKQYFIFLLFVAHAISGFSQEKDSLRSIQLIDSLIDISSHLTNEAEYAKALEVNAKAETLALSIFGEVSQAYGKACFYHAEALYYKDDNEAAAEWYEKSLAIREKALGKKHSDYINTLRSLANAYRYMKEYSKAESIFMEALDIQESISGKQHPDYAFVLKDQASLFRDMNEFDKAMFLYLEVKDIYLKTVGPEHHKYVELLNSLYVFYRETGDYSNMLEVKQETAGIALKTKGKESEAYVDAISVIANLYKEMGDYEQAEPLFIEVKNYYEHAVGTEHRYYASALNDLARFHARKGDFFEAESLYMEAKDIYEKTSGKESSRFASVLNNLGVLHHMKGNYRKAIQYFIEAKDIYLKTKGKVSDNYANSLQNIATIYMDQGDYAPAESLYLEAKQLFAELYGTTHPRYGFLMSSLADLYYNKGDINSAERIYLEVQEIYTNSIGKESPDYADNLGTLAELYVKKGDFAKAEDLLLECKEIAAKSRGEESPSYAHFLHKLAQFYHQTNRIKTAADYFSTQNMLNRKFIERSAAYSSESEMLAYLQFFEEDLASFLSFAQVHPDPELIGQHYDNALFINGLVLNNEQILARAMATADSLTRDIYAQWQNCHRRLAKRYVRHNFDRSKIVKVEIEAEQYEKMLLRNIPAFQETRKIPHWQDVRDQLKPGELAVEFLHYRFYTPEETDSVMYVALLLRRGWDAPKLVPLFEGKALDSLLNIKGARKADYVSRVYALPDRGVVAAEKPQTSLYELIWQPLEKSLQQHAGESPAVSKVYFAPTGLLHRLNLAAIPINTDSTLADRYQLVALGSTRQLLTKGNTEFKYHNAVLFGGIQYDVDSSTLIANSKLPDRIEPESESPDGSLRGESWNYLPGTEKEVNTIEKIMTNNGFEIQVFKGSEATEERFKHFGKNQAPSPRVLHLATHGFFFPDPKRLSEKQQKPVNESETGFKTSNNPLIRSGILLSGANIAWKSGKPLKKGMENGILTAYEIAHLDLSNTELVVLSACETGLGDIQGNEGVFGLQRAFKIAGAKYLIMSLWQVPDKQTSLLMSRFYNNWLEEKMEIPKAFWAAQKELRDIGLDPYQWAGFVLME